MGDQSPEEPESLESVENTKVGKDTARLELDLLKVLCLVQVFPDLRENRKLQKILEDNSWHNDLWHNSSNPHHLSHSPPYLTIEMLVIMVRIYPELIKPTRKKRYIPHKDDTNASIAVEYTPILHKAAGSVGYNYILEDEAPQMTTKRKEDFAFLVDVAEKHDVIDFRFKGGFQPGKTALHEVRDVEYIGILVGAGADINSTGDCTTCNGKGKTHRIMNWQHALK